MEALVQRWNGMYNQALSSSLLKVRQVPGVVLGIHSVIDGLKRMKGADLENLLSDDKFRQDVIAAIDDAPKEIKTPVDFMVALISSMRRGKALQLMVRNQETADWIMEKLGYDTLRMGGTSGNMANSLSPMPFPRLVVYANPLTKELANLFVESPNLYVLAENGEVAHPRDAAVGEGIFALHWIFEYQAGEAVDVPGISFTTPRANRFIAAWNPVNNKLQIKPSFKDNLIAKADEFSHFVVSGFHILSEEYPDGTTWADYLVPVAEYLGALGRQAPNLKLHYEFASIASSKIRQGIVKHILPVMNSLGLNEVELVAVLRDVGEESLAEAIESADSISAVYQGVKKLQELTGLDRIQLHDLGYYLTVVKPEYADGQKTLEGMLMAGTLAASRCQLGRIGDDDEIAQGLAAPISEKGLAKVNELAQDLGEDDLVDKGYVTVDGFVVVMCPTRIVDRPVLTVGLGDIISSSAFILGSDFGREMMGC